jgi:hypothetical protein
MERQSAPTLDTHLVILKCVAVTEHPCGKSCNIRFRQLRQPLKYLMRLERSLKNFPGTHCRAVSRDVRFQRQTRRCLSVFTGLLATLSD